VLLPQVPPQLLGVPEGTGVAVGVGVGVAVGVTVGVTVGEAVGVTVGDAVGEGEAEPIVNVRTQAGFCSDGDGLTSWAYGMLEGTLGATGCCLSW
jgi:hypothetical protein